ncbi:Vacuolar membrane protein [Stagonosporopsis vannaccii]|nr:Vacuolar membrane protein [Stagonosporopsis vannaccii]
MRLSVGLLGLLLAAAPAVLAQDNNNNNNNNNLPQLSTLQQPDGEAASSTAPASSAAPTSNRASTSAAASSAPASSAPATSAQTTSATLSGTTAATADNGGDFPTLTQDVVQLSGLPTLAGIGVPQQQVPDTSGAMFMQKSDLPDGTVFICVGAILGFLGACVLLWRGLVAWSLHRSVKRAALAQNLADMKAMSAVPGKKRGMYTHVGASSTLSLDHLSAAPTGHSRPQKPFAQGPGGTPPRAASSLFFSPTAGGAAGLAQQGNRSSNYLPAGYYAAGTAAPAGGSPMAHVGGPGGHLSTNSLALPGNRFSRASGTSPPESPSLPPSRGYDRASRSRDGYTNYNRSSVATLNTPGNTRSGVYGHGQASVSNLSLNVPGGTTEAGGRAPSAYLEDLFENHGGARSQERF